jgi:hypothetical protein
MGEAGDPKSDALTWMLHGEEKDYDNEKVINNRAYVRGS